MNGVMPLPAVRNARPLASPNATLAARDDVSATLATFIVVLDAPLNGYRAGQYVSVGAFAGGELIQRPYSVVSLARGGTRIELFVRRLPDGRLSNLLWRLPLGERVVIGRPKGLFTLDATDDRPRLMVATGTGVAPLVAMVSAAALAGDSTPNVLIQGASYAFELAHHARMSALVDAWFALDYRPTVSRPTDVANLAWSGLTGRADAQLAALLAERPDYRAGGAVAYLCGNPDMIAACTRVLEDAQFPTGDIRIEQFHPGASATLPRAA